MARKPRIEYEGAFYHVIVRGNRREKIFRDNKDYLKYLEILSSYKKRHHFNIYCFVLMSNHIHLLIECGKTPLSKIQQGINQSYTTYFNRKHNMAGHLFQGRYKAILCDKDRYLLSLIKYIHLNPVRAKIAIEADQYQWSSHKCYIGKGKDDIIDTDRVLRMFSEDNGTSSGLYREFIGDGVVINRDDVYKTVDQRVLGAEEFLDIVMAKYDGEIIKEKREKDHTLAEIAEGVEKIKGVPLKHLRMHNKTSYITSSRKLFILLANEYGYTGREIAEYIRRDPAVISMALKERDLLEKDMERVINSLKKLNF